MKEKDALEQFIEDKLAETQFTYQASHWDQASSQMAAWEAEAARKRRFLWFYLFSGVVFISLAITGVFALSLRGTPESELISQINNPALVSSETNDCDTLIISNPDLLTERSAQPVPSPTLQANNSPRNTKNKLFSGRTRGQQKQTGTNTNTSNNLSLTAKDPNAFSSPYSHPLSASIERSAQQSGIAYLINHIRYRAFSPDSIECEFIVVPNQENSWKQSNSFNFYVQSGASFTATQMGENGGSLQGGRSTASVGIRYNFRPGLALESGIQYHSNHLDELSLSVTGREFDFVAREQTVRWQLEQLHWLSIPLQLSIRPLKRHELTLGASLDYLATSRGTLRQSQQDPFNPTTTIDGNGNGIVYGLRTINYSAQLGYRFYIHPRMALDMRYRYGFRNLLDEAIWTTEAPRFDRQFQVGLLFYLK
ncbi:MAG: outer membrane beta-barrel protein [Bacteroidia bacterium]